MHWLDLLFPPFCQRCKWPGKWICHPCWQHVHWLDPPGFTPHQAYPSLRKVWSLAQYDEAIGRLIQQLKYSRHRVLAQPLGLALARVFAPQLTQWRVECLIAVPLHLKRKRERGFNQAALLAKTVSDQLNIPLDSTLLQRTLWKGTQATQGRAGRQSLQFMFRCSQRAPYSTVCLVDDVFTTGATLSACARALNHAGVKNIVAITLAKA